MTASTSSAHSFEQFLQQKDFVLATISRHHREINKYEKWLKAKDKTIENTTKKDLLDYLQHIKQSRKLCNATQSGILAILKKYYSYLNKEYGTTDITHFIKIRGTHRRRLQQLLTAEELELLCDAYYYHTQQHKPNNYELYYFPNQQKLLQGRYIALTLVAYQALQVLEIQALTQADFDLRKATVTVHASHRGAERKLQLDASQLGILIQYFKDGADSPLVPNANHLERISETLKTLHPKFRDFRQIRASKITHWLKLYGLRKTQYLAGHKNNSSTEQYIAGDFETLQNNIDSFHPLK